ncbi:hypothetical protein BWQ96_08297 [Gracilariopsis chorda]|uniref:Zinc-finger domain-containing protein n=1 Tax=Gracilariopsis chorda TaxID=448386 RepID=A0A2V3ILI4_9FLOR|nr:hypothetical protein BWQ96_08297 [Gracilariopsis chorda]|eukprot:PXF41990.1 hypothetical protein BWQ96_08297 [Gracilariopsis chorda]
MSGDQPLRQPAWAPGFPNVIPSVGTQGRLPRHVGNPFYTQIPPSVTAGILSTPMNPVNPADRVQLPFNESQSYETRPELFGLGWASAGPSPTKETVVLPGTNGVLDGAQFVRNESGALGKPTANGLVQRFDQEQQKNLGSSAVAPQQNCPPHISTSALNAISALAHGAFSVGPQDIGGLLGITQAAQDNAVFNAGPSGVQRLPAVGNLNAPALESLEYPGGSTAGNIRADLAEGQPNAAGGIERAATQAEGAQPTAGIGFEAAQAWEHLLAVNADAVALQNPGGAAGQYAAHLPHQGFVNAGGAKATVVNASAHEASGVHYAHQDMLHDNLRVAMAEANVSRPMVIDAGGKATPAEAGGTCPRPLGIGTSIKDPNSSAVGGSSLAGTPSSQVEEGHGTPSKGQAGPSSSARKARRVNGGISKAGGTGRRHEKRKPRTYSQAVPSQHCHICSRRPTTNAPHMVCGNLLQSRCRKTICTKCFERYNWDLEGARNAEAGTWVCTHCRGECPARAQCVIYNRTSDRRRMKMINHRKKKGAGNGGAEDGKTLPVAGSDQSADNGVVVGSAGPARLASPPPALSVGSTAVEATGSGHVVVGGSRKAGSSKRRIGANAGGWNGSVGKSLGTGKNEGRIRKGGRKGGGSSSNVVVARTREEFIRQMKMHSGDLQGMVRHSGAVPRPSDEERAALPPGDGGFDGGAETERADSTGVERWRLEEQVHNGGEAAEDGVETKSLRGLDGSSGLVAEKFGEAEAAKDGVLEALERLVREAESGEVGHGGGIGDSLDILSGSGEPDKELSAMVTNLAGEGGDGADDGWNVDRWLVNTELAGADGSGERGGDGGLAEEQTRATGVADHYNVVGGGVEEWFGVGDGRETGNWDGVDGEDVDPNDVAALLHSTDYHILL